MGRRKAELAARGDRLGAQYRLGSCLGSERGAADPHPTVAGRVSVVLVPVGVISLGIALGAYLVPDILPAAGPLAAFAACVLGIGAVAGLRLWYSSRNEPVNELFWFSGGVLALDHRAPEPRLLRWSDVTCVTKESAAVLEDQIEVTRYTLCGRGGQSLALGDRDLWYPAGKAFVRYADEVLTSLLLPQVIERYESREAVAFGDVRVDRGGITCGGRTIPWSDVRRLVLSRYLRIRAGTRPLWTTVRMSGRPGGVLLYPLLRHIAAGRDLDVRPRPPRASVPETVPEER